MWLSVKESVLNLIWIDGFSLGTRHLNWCKWGIILFGASPSQASILHKQTASQFSHVCECRLLKWNSIWTFSPQSFALFFKATFLFHIAEHRSFNVLTIFSTGQNLVTECLAFKSNEGVHCISGTSGKCECPTPAQPCVTTDVWVYTEKRCVCFEAHGCVLVFNLFWKR